MQKPTPLFYSSRTDGLGGRLRAIMNAHVLAKHFGGRFGFLWGEMAEGEALNHHSIAPASATFTPDFIAAHRIDKAELAGMRTTKLKTVMEAQAPGGIFSPGADAIEVGQVDLSYQAVVFPSAADRSALLRKAWDDLQFAPSLEAARRHAGTVPFPERTVAIHLRAGDIIYGNYRMTDRFHKKVSSYPIVEEMIRKQIGAGFAPVLFGQDLALCQYLRDRHGVLLANDLSAGLDFDNNQQAIFDIALMSRCERIFAGSSGFAVLAAWIAGVDRKKPLPGYRPLQKLELIEAAIFAEETSEGVSPLQRAFACRNAFVISGVHFSTEPRFQKLLDHAREMDPENTLYQFVQAMASYAYGDVKTGEEIIGNILLGENGPFLKSFFMHQNDEPRHEVDPYLPVLTRQAELGSAMAALFVSRAYDFRGDQVRAAQFAALFQTHASANLAR